MHHLVIPGSQWVSETLCSIRPSASSWPLDREPMLVANSIASAGGEERGSLFLTRFSPMDGATWTLAPCLHFHFKYKGSPFSKQKFGCTISLSYGTVFFPSYSYPMLHLLKKRSELSSYICFPLDSMLNLPAAAFDFSVVWSIRFGSLTVQAVSGSHVQSSRRMSLQGKSNTMFSSLQCSAQLDLSLKTRECCPFHL